MNYWLILQNIADFRLRLEQESKPETRKLLQKLLLAEQKKLLSSDERGARGQRKGKGADPETGGD